MRIGKADFERQLFKVRLSVDEMLWGKHMGLEGIKLIACDLDGTLLHPGEREPRSEAFELIDELHRREPFCFFAGERPSICELALPVCPGGR